MYAYRYVFQNNAHFKINNKKAKNDTQNECNIYYNYYGYGLMMTEKNRCFQILSQVRLEKPLNYRKVGFNVAK